MNVVLSDELESVVRERIASGRYADAEAVLADALAALDQRDWLTDEARTDAQRKIDRGLSQLQAGQSVNGEAFFARLHVG